MTYPYRKIHVVFGLDNLLSLFPVLSLAHLVYHSDMLFATMISQDKFPIENTDHSSLNPSVC